MARFDAEPIYDVRDTWPMSDDWPVGRSLATQCIDGEQESPDIIRFVADENRSHISYLELNNVTFGAYFTIAPLSLTGSAWNGDGTQSYQARDNINMLSVSLRILILSPQNK